jgi:predicted nuclease of predicted toxin-antitoxin system
VRFLIDECLHTSLTDVANKAGHEAYHVTRRGWTGFKDHQLREVISRGEFVFVTNNARDFRKLMGESELHAGLNCSHSQCNADRAARTVRARSS